MRSLLLALSLALLGGCSLLQPKSEVSPPVISAKLAAPPTVAAAATPTPPPNQMTVPLGYNLTLSWSAVTAYTSGAPLTQTANYKLYTYNPTNGSIGFQGYLGVGVLTTQRVQSTEGQKCYELSAQVYDPNANESARTAPICVLVQGTAPPVTSPPGQPLPVCVK